MYCKIATKFFDVMDKVYTIQSKKVSCGESVDLFRSEINFLCAVEENEKANVSVLSNLLGVTKGAVTQVSDKLIEKCMLERYSLESNKKEKFYRLTQDGCDALQTYRDMHRKTNNCLCGYFSGLTRTEQEIIAKFFDQIESVTPIAKYECNKVNGGCLQDSKGDN